MLAEGEETSNHGCEPKTDFPVNLSLYSDFDGDVVPGSTRMYLMNVSCQTFMKVGEPINKLISTFVLNLEFDGRATRNLL